MCYEYNNLRPSLLRERDEVLRRLLGSIGSSAVVEQPFYCDYGYNISVGNNFFVNFNCVMLDEAPIVFGDNVFIGPNCSFYTASHPLDVRLRNQGLETAAPITVGDNVWFGGSVTVLPGVKIGRNCVIGAGSIVTRDIPDNAVAYGNPCKVAKIHAQE